MTNFLPLRNQVLLDVEPEPELSDIIRVQRSVEGLCRLARVIAVGPEVRHVKPGERVLASLTAGIDLPWGLVLSESAILSHVDD